MSELFKKCRVELKQVKPQIFVDDMIMDHIIVGRIPLNFNEEQAKNAIQKHLLADYYEITSFTWIDTD